MTTVTEARVPVSVVSHVPWWRGKLVQVGAVVANGSRTAAGRPSTRGRRSSSGITSGSGSTTSRRTSSTRGSSTGGLRGLRRLPSLRRQPRHQVQRTARLAHVDRSHGRRDAARLAFRWLARGRPGARGVRVVRRPGLWAESMETLALMLAAVGLSILIGVPFGILAGRSARFNRALTPFLDAAQIVPARVPDAGRPLLLDRIRSRGRRDDDLRDPAVSASRHWASGGCR